MKLRNNLKREAEDTLKAHKFCQACQTYTHVKKAKQNNGVCSCGSTFPVTSLPIKPQSPVEDNIAGSRVCRQPDCGKRTRGPRSKFCTHCGQPFEQASPKVEIVETEIIRTPFTPPKEITFDIEGYYISDELREKYVFPFGTKVLNMAETQPAFRLEHGHSTLLPSDTVILRWADELRKHMLGLRRTWVTNGCLYSFFVQQFKGTHDLKSEDMEWVRVLLGGLPDVQRNRSLVAIPA